MPVNKNVQYRFRTLDKCLSDFSREYTFEDLLSEVNRSLKHIDLKPISIRQLRKDIENLGFRPYKAKIIAHLSGIGNKRYYRYADRNFSIFKNELSPEELHNLRSTIEMLGRYRCSANSWLEEVISNLEYRFGVKSNIGNVVVFDQNDRLKGLEHLSTVIDATANQQPLLIVYITFNGTEKNGILHPYHVRQYNNRWFLFGLEDSTGMIVNYALDRIQSIKIENVDFRPNTGIDFSHYFEDIVGVSVPREEINKERIVMKFSSKRFPYIVSKPIHKSQKVEDMENNIISIEVKPTRELDALLLSYGPDMEILSPVDYKNRILDFLRLSIKNYE